MTDTEMAQKTPADVHGVGENQYKNLNTTLDRENWRYAKTFRDVKIEKPGCRISRQRVYPQWTLEQELEAGVKAMKSILIRDTTREERVRIVQQALWGSCGIDCEFCSGCDNRGGGRIESIYQPYIDGSKEIREINEAYRAPLVRG